MERVFAQLRKVFMISKAFMFFKHLNIIQEVTITMKSYGNSFEGRKSLLFHYFAKN